jgi:4-diphosphocytidyl-2-C-methyl-D-erythritol kinase
VARALNAVRVRCPAKINLGLWVLGRRRDGFHEIDTYLQTVGLEDELVLEAGAPGLALETSGRAIPGPGPNLLERAWAVLKEAGALPRGAGVRARLVKRIPVGAGLGGGSSDAAGFLLGLDRLLGLSIKAEDARSFAARLGADVPFFLRGGLARATGRGDQVRHLGPRTGFWAVLVSPPAAISTGWAYQQLRNRLTPRGSGARVLASAVATGDLGAVAGAMHNAFERVLLPRFPEIAALKQALAASGALGTLLSGSGSTVFGITRSRKEALAVASAVGSRGAEIRVVRTVERGVVVSRQELTAPST